MKYKILFIDEEKNVLYEFMDYVEGSEFVEKIEVITEYPSKSLDEILEKIIQLSPDAIVSDFRLNEKKTDINFNVPYTGVELIEAFLDIREGFPCFIMTSFDDDAMIESEDVNKIYIKEILHRQDIEKGAQVSFLGRLVKQIENYQSRIEESDKKLQELLKLRKKGEITLGQEEELIKLDSFLERSVNQKSSVPKDLKKIANGEKLHSLLSKADLLLDRLGRKND